MKEKEYKCFIGDLDKVKLLTMLWEEGQPARFFRINHLPAPIFDENEAKYAVKDFIDYFCGRAIKTDLSGDYASTQGYNRDMGDGAFERVCMMIRTNGEITGKKNFPCVEKYFGEEMCRFCKSYTGNFTLMTIQGEGYHACKDCINEDFVKFIFPWFQPEMIK